MFSTRVRMVALLAAFSAAAAQAQISDGVVRIGVLGDMSGPYSDAGGAGAVVAARMAVEDFQAGGASDFRIEIVSADHQSKADVGSAIARQWYDVDGVDAIADLTNSAVALAVNEIARAKGKAVLATSPATSALTGKACSPTTIQWTSDTWMLTHAIGDAVVRSGGDSWFFLSVDYTFGHELERQTGEVVQRSGGRVLGSVRHPLNTQDFSSFLLQAQASKAKIIGLASSGADTINAIKQGADFGIRRGGQQFAGLMTLITDVHALGLESAQGLLLAEPFYWDLNEGTRAWSERFASLHRGRKPTMNQAGVYAGVLHYLKAVRAAGSDDGRKAIDKMKELPTDDPLFGPGTIRQDGRKIHPVYLFEVKKPAESKYPWDYYKLRATVPAEKAFRPISEGGCPLVQ
ncbi:MAG: ABC transporter substrate-binding protein [Burkholderiaceae bacterium]|nr:ABC transporter substrate-binding protein [Burkholderiaceae bacterium]